MTNFENIDCCVCGNNNSKKLYQIKYASRKALDILEIKEKPESFLYKCSSCGHHYTNPQISQELLTHYYSELNSEYYNLVDKPTNHLEKEHQDIVDIVLRYQRPNAIAKKTILEIGSGCGFLLNRFDSDCWQKYGVEPSSYAASFASNELKLDIHKGFLTNDLFPGDFFDVILLFDVIEHLKIPRELMDIIRHQLKPGGLLIIGTGDIRSLNAMVSGAHWGYFASWEHLSFFSPETIKFLLNKNGFTPEKIFRRSYQGGLLRNYVVLFKNIVKKLTVFLVGKSSKYSHTNYQITLDHLIVVARKRQSESPD